VREIAVLTPNGCVLIHRRDLSGDANGELPRSNMLLLYQVGSVKIGEVVRYTVTYTPSRDRILPPPEVLYLRIRNTSAIALRAAFVHGPYTLSVAAYPSHYSPNEKWEEPRRYGVPEFEPMLKAGGSWSCRLVVPDDVRQGAGLGAGLGVSKGHFGASGEGKPEPTASWTIEVQSQVIFSTSAAVNYEVLVARDEKSLSLGSAVPVIGGNQAQVPQPGRVSDYQRGLIKTGAGPAQERRSQQKGVFSGAVHLKLEDTASLWNKPLLPGWDEDRRSVIREHGIEVPFDPVGSGESADSLKPPQKPKKVHMVILTHGIHSNLGGDMLFLKESIDAGVKQARIDARARKAKERAERQKANKSTGPRDNEHGGRAETEERGEGDEDEEDEEEEVIVRGYSGNATRTEKGIKYLGKRLARYVLSMTYPDQPFMPSSKAAADVAHSLKGAVAVRDAESKPVHKHSTIQRPPSSKGERLYKITKISFIAHSLGGLVQTYAVAYIQKHSPQFFDLIEPINFIAMATPFLGLNHENPLYVKFGLDFGLIGRTGQDLGLTWRAPTLARSGWGALVNLGENAHKRVLGEAQPESKPLLRILPTGPAHIALKKFRNRTVYSNVVNDGIVPLRTSCLLFLDWHGLDRVEKARREMGLVESVVGFGWAELTGANAMTPRPSTWNSETETRPEKKGTVKTQEAPGADEDGSHEVPQPSNNATLEDDRQSLRAVANPQHEAKEAPHPSDDQDYSSSTTNNSMTNPFTGFFNLFRSETPKSPTSPSQKQKKIFERSQTLRAVDSSTTSTSASSSKSRVTTGNELSDEGTEGGGFPAPPRTTFFESAVDLINPRLPSVEYLIDPTKRPRTIFHDRIYHPADIPPLPLKRRPTGTLALRRRSYTQRTSSSNFTNSPASQSSQSPPPHPPPHTSSANSSASSPFPSPSIVHEGTGLSTHDYDDTAHTNPDRQPNEAIDASSLKVEEKIARAYHRDMSWRKVLVQLEPDAHNNMIVRRMFANAFGWPVIKHLVDAHFSDSAAARTRDDEEGSGERAKPMDEAPDEHGGETSAGVGKGKSGAETGQVEGEAKKKNASSLNDPAADADIRSTDRTPDKKAERRKTRTTSEAREERDALSALPDMSQPSHSSQHSHPPLHNGLDDTPPGEQAASAGRPDMRERLGSATWSDRDWADSADETEGEDEDATGEHPAQTEPQITEKEQEDASG
jgi:hypothetical protein